MSKRVADQILERLAEWGVSFVFGYPGDGINGLMGAFNRDDHGCRFIQARHEEMAAFMACSYAKFTGKVGVCIATSGPGAIHLLNGLYDAKMDHQPVVAIVGQAATTAIGGSYQQEVDLHTLFKDVAAEYVHTAMSPDQVRFLVDRAFRTAASERCPTCIIVPKDVQEMAAVEAPPHAHDTAHSSAGYSPPRVVPAESEIKRAADILNAGERVAILVGAGATGALDEVLLVQDLLGGGIAKALLGRAVVPDDLPFVTGPIGLLGSKPSWDMMMECDTLLMVGSSFPYSEFLPKEGRARGVQIDIDPKLIGIRYPMECNLVGDAKLTLGALVPFLARKADRSWENSIAKGVAEWWRLMEDRAHLPANPINPQRVFWELSPRLPDKAILCADSGSAANWFARDLKLRRGMSATLSGSLATMGCGVPYAIGAKFACPDRPVIALVGDGAMQMNGMAELLTIKRYWKTWSDPRLVVLVLHNNDLNQVTWEMRAMAGDTRYAASQDLPDFDYTKFAELCGLRGVRVDRPDQIGAAWDEALASPVPTIIEAMVDPDVPPLPPHITLKQMQSFGMSLLKGDQAESGLIKQAAMHLFPSLGKDR
ncbi:MAG TPA: thiamine pyrophosphate-requiring protein [Polyangiaceae bacterium]|jgi:pyruvate dehydrogenase (quinone)|nr:thiamine pyrophosphate-requiring protein [Polyangiaceae bacterium]